MIFFVCILNPIVIKKAFSPQGQEGGRLEESRVLGVRKEFS